MLKEIQIPLTLFILGLFLSIIFSQDKIQSIKELYKYITGISLLLAGFSLRKEDTEKVIYCLVAASVLISLLAIYQYFFGFRHLLSYVHTQGISDNFTLDYISQRRVFFPFVTPNILAGYLVMMIPLALAVGNNILFIVPLSIALLLTKSIGALISLFCGLAAYFYLKGELRRKGIIFLGGISVIILIMFIIRANTQKQHLLPLFSTVMRLNYWEKGLEIIKLHPFAGVGLGNFNLAQSRYAHNSYLQLWAEIGTLGIFAFLWLVWSLLRIRVIRLKEKAKDRISSGIFLASIIFLLHNLIDFTFFLPEVCLLWWVILAASFTSLGLKSEKTYLD